MSAANEPAGQGAPLETGRTSGTSGAGAQNQGQLASEARFLAEGEQTAAEVAGWLADFIRGAQQSLDIAIYDFRLSDPLKSIVAGALHERAAAGVRRIGGVSVQAEPG